MVAISARAWFAGFAFWSSVGCSAALPMDSAGSPAGQAHTTIPYTGVRNDMARFEDYSVVDATILDGSPQPDKDWRRR